MDDYMLIDTTCGSEVREENISKLREEDDLSKLRKEVEDLRQQVTQQSFLRDFSRIECDTPSGCNYRRPFMKPKDISPLKSTQLSKVEGSALVTSFFNQIREVTKEYYTPIRSKYRYVYPG